MTPFERARHCLRGLCLGDAFGELFFREPFEAISRRTLPPGLWRYTDDTHMAISIVRVLRDEGHVDQNRLAAGFVAEFEQEPWRGYAGGARQLLSALARGADWSVEAPALFDGGSFGNGGAMRAAPIGAYFHRDAERAAAEGSLSSAITHAHPEGRAGAMAVAAAAAVFASAPDLRGAAFLTELCRLVPDGRTRDGISAALDIAPTEEPRAVRELGTGSAVSAMDTVPFCLWMAAHHGADFEDAMWRTVGGLGDRDTTCAIVAGIITADGRTLPKLWNDFAEDLPDDLAGQWATGSTSPPSA